jgi:hypothetical protein
LKVNSNCIARSSKQYFNNIGARNLWEYNCIAGISNRVSPIEIVKMGQRERERERELGRGIKRARQRERERESEWKKSYEYTW